MLIFEHTLQMDNDLYAFQLSLPHVCLAQNKKKKKEKIFFYSICLRARIIISQCVFQLELAKMGERLVQIEKTKVTIFISHSR